MRVSRRARSGLCIISPSLVSATVVYKSRAGVGSLDYRKGEYLDWHAYLGEAGSLFTFGYELLFSVL